MAPASACGAHDDQQKNDEEEDGPKIFLLNPGTLRNGAAGPLVFAGGGLDDRVDTGDHACVVVTGFEMRLDAILGDVFGGDVRNRAFQPVANLEIHLPVVDEDKENRAVAFAFLTDAPVLSDAQRVIVDGRFGLHVFENRDDDLSRVGLFELFEPRIELIANGGRGDAGVVVEVARRFSGNDFGRKRAAEEEQRENQPQKREEPTVHLLVLLKSNWTCGGRSEPAVASK